MPSKELAEKELGRLTTIPACYTSKVWALRAQLRNDPTAERLAVREPGVPSKPGFGLMAWEPAGVLRII